MNTSFGGTGAIGRAFGSNNFNDCNSGTTSNISTPRMFRYQSNASGAPHLIASNSYNGNGSLGGFQIRGSNVSVFEPRFSNITFQDHRTSNPTSLIEQR